jgi:hypothetical protein
VLADFLHAGVFAPILPSVTCTSGVSCTFNVTGYGLSNRDRMWLVKGDRCTDQNSAATILYASTDSGRSFTFSKVAISQDDIANVKETYSACWCSYPPDGGGSVCTVVGEFNVLAQANVNIWGES